MTFSFCDAAHLVPPTIEFCERRLCQFPAEPANAWSNLAYVLFGLLILRLAKREQRWNLWPAGVTAILIGFCSFSFHAYPVFLTEFVDLFSMYLLSIYMLAVQLYRALGWGIRNSVAAYFLLLTCSTMVLWWAREPGITIFSIQIVGALALEAWIASRQRDNPTEYRYFFVLIGFFALSLGFWLLDLHRIVCIPDNHLLQGHALWHITNSTCFYWMYRYAAQFDWSRAAFWGSTSGSSS